jgi:hypothetical protein
LTCRHARARCPGATILAGADSIASNHLLEAIQYRSLDRNLFY